MYNNLKIQNTRILNNILGFWGSILSNFHIHNFKYENIWFPSSEHAFMWKKADYFQDNEAKDLILSTKLPRKAKDYGLKVKNFNEKEWTEVSYQFMVEILMEKFSQSKSLTDSLLSTKDLVIVEGSPFDKKWGVGIHWEEDACYDQTKWKGQNLLGKALMEVRETLKNKALEKYFPTKECS